MKIKNLAFIDGQNLHMGTTKIVNPWKIDFKKFRIFLKDKYKVEYVYYFIGFVIENNQDLYTKIKNSGFLLIFREHNSMMIGNKKGNVDSDIIFYIMKKIYKKEDFNKIILISGDGDYRLLVDFLIEEERFEKIIFPNRFFASSLYKKLTLKYFDYLDRKDIKNKISLKNKKSS